MKSRLRSLFLGDALIGPCILAIAGVWLSLSLAMGRVAVPASWWVALGLAAVSLLAFAALAYVALRMSALLRQRTAQLTPNQRH